MKLKPGMLAPDFLLPDQSGGGHSLKEYRGKWVILYFYPKDDTPGCTAEACSFRDTFSSFKRGGVVILGVSVDPIKQHQKFSDKYALPFPLLSDEKKSVVKKYSVWEKKKFMGREYFGIKRTTFIIDPQGKIVKIFETVKPKGHAEEVLAAILDIKKCL